MEHSNKNKKTKKAKKTPEVNPNPSEYDRIVPQSLRKYVHGKRIVKAGAKLSSYQACECPAAHGKTLEQLLNNAEPGSGNQPNHVDFQDGSGFFWWGKKGYRPVSEKETKLLQKDKS